MPNVTPPTSMKQALLTYRKARNPDGTATSLVERTAQYMHTRSSAPASGFTKTKRKNSHGFPQFLSIGQPSHADVRSVRHPAISEWGVGSGEWWVVSGEWRGV